jgi:hypothetical protein
VPSARTGGAPPPPRARMAAVAGRVQLAPRLPKASASIARHRLPESLPGVGDFHPARPTACSRWRLTPSPQPPPPRRPRRARQLADSSSFRFPRPRRPLHRRGDIARPRHWVSRAATARPCRTRRRPARPSRPADASTGSSTGRSSSANRHGQPARNPAANLSASPSRPARTPGRCGSRNHARRRWPPARALSPATPGPARPPTRSCRNRSTRLSRRSARARTARRAGLPSLRPGRRRSSEGDPGRTTNLPPTQDEPGRPAIPTTSALGRGGLLANPSSKSAYAAAAALRSRAR